MAVRMRSRCSRRARESGFQDGKSAKKIFACPPLWMPWTFNLIPLFLAYPLISIYHQFYQLFLVLTFRAPVTHLRSFSAVSERLSARFGNFVRRRNLSRPLFLAHWMPNFRRGARVGGQGRQHQRRQTSQRYLRRRLFQIQFTR